MGWENSDRNKLSPRTKLFRKFFIENGAYFEPQVEFIEITNILLARKFGIMEEGLLHYFTNQSDFITIKGELKTILNLKLIANQNTANSEKGKWIVDVI